VHGLHVAGECGEFVRENGEPALYVVLEEVIVFLKEFEGLEQCRSDAAVVMHSQYT